MYSMSDEITFCHCGADGKLKLHEAVTMMMNCCQFQEYQEQELCKFLRSNNIAIFLSSLQIDIIRMPEFREKLRTTVKIYGYKSIYGLRRLTMHDASGELCLIANATGAFIDIKEQKALKLSPEVFQLKYDEPEPMECLPRKISLPAAGTVERCDFTGIKVTPSMLDPNGHLTSPEYFAIATDILPEDFRFNRARVEYKKQAKCGELLTPVRYLNEATRTATAVISNADGQTCAVLEFSTTTPE